MKIICLEFCYKMAHFPKNVLRMHRVQATTARLIKLAQGVVVAKFDKSLFDTV